MIRLCHGQYQDPRQSRLVRRVGHDTPVKVCKRHEHGIAGAHDGSVRCQDRLKRVRCPCNHHGQPLPPLTRASLSWVSIPQCRRICLRSYRMRTAPNRSWCGAKAPGSPTTSSTTSPPPGWTTPSGSPPPRPSETPSDSSRCTAATTQVTADGGLRHGAASPRSPDPHRALRQAKTLHQAWIPSPGARRARRTASPASRAWDGPAGGRSPTPRPRTGRQRRLGPRRRSRTPPA